MWDQEQSRLEEQAAQVRAQLGLDMALRAIGTIHIVGSAALHLMVDRDIDLTVVVKRLDQPTLRAAAEVGARLSTRADVRDVMLRNDTGRWNTDPEYPNGFYLRVVCVDQIGETWSLDIWFVDEPSRQPDLQHLTSIGPRITPTMQSTILAIKRATQGKRADGSRLPSFEIYEAVLDRGVTRPEDLEASSADVKSRSPTRN